MAAAAAVRLPRAVAGIAQIERVALAAHDRRVVDARDRTTVRRPEIDLDLVRERSLEHAFGTEPDDPTRGDEGLPRLGDRPNDDRVRAGHLRREIRLDAGCER